MLRGHIVMRALRSLLAILLALVVIVLVNQGGGELADLAGFAGGGERRLALDLAWVFIAGVLATWVAVRLAPCAPRAHAAALCVLMLLTAAVAVVRIGGDWPRWFSVGVLLAPPLQAWFGTGWALQASQAAPDPERDQRNSR